MSHGTYVHIIAQGNTLFYINYTKEHMKEWTMSCKIRYLDLLMCLYQARKASGYKVLC